MSPRSKTKQNPAVVSSGGQLRTKPSQLATPRPTAHLLCISCRHELDGSAGDVFIDGPQQLHARSLRLGGRVREGRL